VSDRRYGMFDSMLSDLTTIRPDIRDVIWCPLCLNPFGRDALDTKEFSKALSEEDIIPKALGGRIVTLTCKRCNNTDGSEVDSQFVQKVRMDEALLGYHGSIGSEVYINGHRVLAEIECQQGEGGTTKIVVKSEGSYDAEIKASQQAFLQGVVEKIQLDMRLRYKPNMARLGVVRSAYLAMFSRFGYRYILNDSVEHIRQLIHKRDLSNELLESMSIESIKLHQDVQHPLYILHYTQPMGTSFYVVLIKLSLNSISYHGAIMPNIVPNALNVYQELRTLSKYNPTLQLQFEDIPTPTDGRA
jgi:hypothetical protein